MRFKDGTPNQLTQSIVSPLQVKYVRNLMPMNFYAQDQWTRNRLTLQGGIRYDHMTVVPAIHTRRRRCSIRRDRRPGTTGAM